MAWRCYLEERCKERGIQNPRQLAKVTQLSIDAIRHWWGRQRIEALGRESLELKVLERILRKLNCQFGDIFELEEPYLQHFLRGRPVTLAFGSRRYVLLDPSYDRRSGQVAITAGRLRTAVDMWDVRAFTMLTPYCPWPDIVETPCTLEYQDPAAIPAEVTKEAETLLAKPESVIISLGSPLASGLTDVALLHLQQAGHVNLPFRLVWDFNVQARRWYHRGLGNPQGIEWNHNLLVEIPSLAEIATYPREKPYTDGCLLVVMNQGTTSVVLCMGFMGPGTKAGAWFLWSDRFGTLMRRYTEYCARQAGTPPLCVALRVTCKKTGAGPRAIDLVTPEGQRNEFVVEDVAWYPEEVGREV